MLSLFVHGILPFYVTNNNLSDSACNDTTSKSGNFPRERFGCREIFQTCRILEFSVSFHNCSRMTRAVRYFAFESCSPHLGARWRRPSLELDLFCFCLFLSFTKRCCLWQSRPWEGDRLLSIPDGLPAFIQAFLARGLHPLSVSSTYLLFGAHFLFLAIKHCSHWRPWLRNYLCRCPQRSAPELLTQNLFFGTRVA